MGLATILLGACMHLVAAVSQQFPRSPPLHAPPDIPPLLAPLIRNSDSSCGLLSRKWKDPRPSLSQPLKSSQRDDVIVFGCQSTTRPLSLSLSSVKSIIRGCSFHAPRSGQQILRVSSLAPSLCEMRVSGWSLSCPICVRFCVQEGIGEQYWISVNTGRQWLRFERTPGPSI